MPCRLDQVIAFSGAEVRDEDVTVLLGLVEPRILGQTVRAIAANDLPTLLRIVADLVESGQDLNNFCRRLSAQFRNLMVLKTGISDPALLGIAESMLPDLTEQANLFSKEDLMRLFDAFQRIEAGMKYATQVRFQLEMGLIELAHITRLRPLEEVIAELSAMSSGEEPRPRPVVQKPALSKTSPSAEETPADPKALLLRIASAVGRESLESVLQNLAGARLQGGKVILMPAAQANSCGNRSVPISLIAEAASSVIGTAVSVSVAGEIQPNQARARREKTPPPPPQENDLLEKVKSEPVVKSFLDVFPGPVEAKKIDS